VVRRRNRLKAYEALYLMATRDFKESAKLFLEAVPTFGSYELMSYEDLVVYTVVTCMLGALPVIHARRRWQRSTVRHSGTRSCAAARSRSS